ncbi:hypothetical protein [Vulcanisaeta thermophila]|uniref:hypothetical protein n=1 Tax=Vulcanisaeta thermophila TaxID=867917 RepID=UPI00117DD655|nr:hypothetical protein [Vulcanisaeta thermophila]
MGLVRDVREGFTGLIYYVIFNVITMVVLYLGPTNLLIIILQLLLLPTWTAMGLFAWDHICVINRVSCRLAGVYRSMTIIIPIFLLFTVSVLFLSRSFAMLLYLVVYGLYLGLSVIGYVTIYLIGRQFRRRSVMTASLASVVGVVLWLPLISTLMIAGTAIVGVSSVVLVITLRSIRNRYLG